jgi:hypothetical protein
MRTATLSRTVRRLTASIQAASCPACASWPPEIAIRFIEIIIEPGEELPPPDPPRPDPSLFGPCLSCGRRHKARIVEVATEETS